eukprot:549473-Rhodomonas_salina.1
MLSVLLRLLGGCGEEGSDLGFSPLQHRENGCGGRSSSSAVEVSLEAEEGAVQALGAADWN